MIVSDLMHGGSMVYGQENEWLMYCMYFVNYGRIYWYIFVNRRRYNQNYYWPPYRAILISRSGKHGFNHLANSFSKSTGGIFSRSFAFNSRGCLSRAIKKLSCRSLYDRGFLRCNPWLCHGNLFSLEYFWFVYLHAACSRHCIWFYYSSFSFWYYETRKRQFGQ